MKRRIGQVYLLKLCWRFWKMVWLVVVVESKQIMEISAYTLIEVFLSIRQIIISKFICLQFPIQPVGHHWDDTNLSHRVIYFTSFFFPDLTRKQWKWTLIGKSDGIQCHRDQTCIINCLRVHQKICTRGQFIGNAVKQIRLRGLKCGIPRSAFNAWRWRNEWRARSSAIFHTIGCCSHLDCGLIEKKVKKLIPSLSAVC